MGIVVLLAGPRGAGKSSYAELVKKAHPDIVIISRDEMAQTLFGSVHVEPHSFQFRFLYSSLQNEIKYILGIDRDAKIILDCYSGTSEDRKVILSMLRAYGAQHVACWKFITPLDTCLKWFSKKKDKDHWSSRECAFLYGQYMGNSHTIETDGFDSVRTIDPSRPESLNIVFP